MSQFKNLQLLALDVDGVLSDGRLYYTDQGEEFKSFNIRDGLGIKLLQRAGITVAIITGRTSAMVTRRAAELSIAHVVKGREDKLEALLDLCGNLKIDLSNVAYMGDDLPDRKAIMAVGLGATVADAASDVAAIADWQSRLPGGQGAVRELAEAWLRSLDLCDALIETV